MLEPQIGFTFRTSRGTVRVSGGMELAGMELARLPTLIILNFGVGARDVPRSFGLLDFALARRFSIRMTPRELLRFTSPDTLRVSSPFVVHRMGSLGCESGEVARDTTNRGCALGFPHRLCATQLPYHTVYEPQEIF